MDIYGHIWTINYIYQFISTLRPWSSWSLLRSTALGSMVLGGPHIVENLKVLWFYVFVDIDIPYSYWRTVYIYIYMSWWHPDVFPFHFISYRHIHWFWCVCVYIYRWYRVILSDYPIYTGDYRNISLNHGHWEFRPLNQCFKGRESCKLVWVFPAFSG